MERRHFATYSVFLKAVSERLSAFQKRSAAAKSSASRLEQIKVTRGIILVFLSFIFGWASLSVTAESTIQHYRNSQWPSQAVWYATLKQFQFREETNPGAYPSLLLQHPNAFSGESVAWLSEDGCFLYLPVTPYGDSGMAELWVCSPRSDAAKIKVKKWLKLGSGWNAFEKLADELQKIPKKEVPTPIRHRNNIDPKEIRY